MIGNRGLLLYFKDEIYFPINHILNELSALLDTDTDKKQTKIISVIRKDIMIIVVMLNDLHDYLNENFDNYVINIRQCVRESISIAKFKLKKFHKANLINIKCSFAKKFPILIYHNGSGLRLFLINIFILLFTFQSDITHIKLFIRIVKNKKIKFKIIVNKAFNSFLLQSLTEQNNIEINKNNFPIAIIQKFLKEFKTTIHCKGDKELSFSVDYLHAPMITNEVTSEAQKKKILVVDDHFIHTNQIKCIFNYYKLFDIDIAYNGEQAIKLVKQFHYDIIFMDVKMPKKDGITTAIEIKSLENSTLIVALVQDKNNIEFINKHECFDDFIIKPIYEKDVLKFIFG